MKQLKIFLTIFSLSFVFGQMLQAVPAPSYNIYGLVKDGYGNTLLSDEDAKVSFYLDGVETLTVPVSILFGEGHNYLLRVPMDAGYGFTDPYDGDAGVYNQTFTIRLNYGGIVYIPIEVMLVSDSLNLGFPGGNLQLDLTMGVDLDGDGIPDQWEIDHIANMVFGDGIETIQDVDGFDDFDGDGVSNYDEYMALTYAFDPGDYLYLDIVTHHTVEAVSELKFLIITGKTYTIE